MENISPDLNEYAEIIHGLVPYAQHPKLDVLLKKLAPKCNAHKLFLLKMEIRRLAKPCTLVLDLRMLFDTCVEVEHDKIIHYLDPVSKSTFFRLIKASSGIFTRGAYSLILNDAKARYAEQQEAKKKEYNKNVVVVDRSTILINRLSSDTFCRDEKIGVYGAAAVLSRPDAELTDEECCTLGTVGEVIDFSEAGIVIKAPFRSLSSPTGSIFIRVFNLARPLGDITSFSLRGKIAHIKDSFSKVNTFYKVVFRSENNSPSVESIRAVCQGMERVAKETVQKHRTPLVQSITAKMLESKAQSVYAGLSILCGHDSVGGKREVKVIQRSAANENLFKYFGGTKNFACKLLNLPSLNVSFLSDGDALFEEYVFTGVSEGRIYALTLTQLLSDNDAVVALKAICKMDWRCLKVSAIPVDAQGDARHEAAVPDWVSPQIALFNKPLSRRVAEILRPLNTLITLTDVTSLVRHTMSLVVKSECRNAKTIKPFYVGTTKGALVRNVVMLESTELRSEDRYLMQFDCILPASPDRSSPIYGRTLNVSARGLCLRLQSPIKTKVGDILKFDMTISHGRDSKQLNGQPYQVLSNDGNGVLRLVVAGLESRHVASNYLRQLIYRYKDTLHVSSPISHEIPGLGKAMRAIVAKNMMHLPLFVKWHNRECILHSAGTSRYPHFDDFVAGGLSGVTAFCEAFRRSKVYGDVVPAMNRVSDAGEGENALYVLAGRDGEGVNTPVLSATGEGSLTAGLLENITRSHMIWVRFDKTTAKVNKYYRDEMTYLAEIDPVLHEELEGFEDSLLGVAMVTDITELYEGISAVIRGEACSSITTQNIR